MSNLKFSGRTINIRLNRPHGENDPSMYYGSAWTCALIGNKVVIYLHGQEFKRYHKSEVEYVNETR